MTRFLLLLFSNRVLSKFAFSLSQDCELPNKKEVSRAVFTRVNTRHFTKSIIFVLFQKMAILREQVMEVLVQHHLFSWDL